MPRSMYSVVRFEVQKICQYIDDHGVQFIIIDEKYIPKKGDIIMWSIYGRDADDVAIHVADRKYAHDAQYLCKLLNRGIKTIVRRVDDVRLLC